MSGVPHDLQRSGTGVKLCHQLQWGMAEESAPVKAEVTGLPMTSAGEARLSPEKAGESQ